MCVAERLVEALGHRGHHDRAAHRWPSAASASASAATIPRRRVVVRRRGRVEHQHRGVLRAVHHRGEAARHRRPIAPHERVVVERVADRDQLGERRLDPSSLLGGERLRTAARVPSATVGDQRRLAAGAAQRDDPRPLQPAAVVEQLQRLQQLGRRVRTVATP